jgi:putative spermidine/putrescine transport system substrate-binding protein
MNRLKLLGTTTLALLTGLTPALAQVTALGDAGGPGEHRRLARLYRARRNRQGLRLGDQVRGRLGCKVNVKTANTSDEMVALMNEGGFDLVTASGDASLRLVAGDRVQPINTDLIPSWSTVDDRLQKRALAHGRRRALRRALHVGAERADVQHRGLQGSRRPRGTVVFEEQTLPDGKSNKGRVQAYDGPIHIADAAQYLMAHKPELGITSPYELNEDQYKAALDLLRGQRELVSRYWHDAFIQMDDFKNEGVVASGSWPFQVNLLKAEGLPIASTIPEEGATGWADTTMMHVDAKNPTCAYLWMEHSLASNLQGDLSVWFGSNPSVPAACTDGRACRRRKAAPRTGWTISTRSGSGPRRCRTASPGRRGLRALLPLGQRLHRRDRRALRSVIVPALAGRGQGDPGGGESRPGNPHTLAPRPVLEGARHACPLSDAP